MKPIENLLRQRKLVLTTATLMALLGAISWQTMIRQEDPDLPQYFAQIVTVFPGADAETVERLVLEPLEEELAEIDGIKQLDASAQAELAVVQIDLREGISEIEEAWDEVREAIDRARREFPSASSVLAPAARRVPTSRSLSRYST